MEFNYSDHTYRMARKIEMFDQVAILLKITPLLASGFGEIVPMVVELQRSGLRNFGEAPLEAISKIAIPVSRELAKMPDEDRRLIISRCLGTIDRRREGAQGWAPIWSAEASRAMFDDVGGDMLLVIRISIAVLQETYKSFFSDRLLTLFGVEPALLLKS